MSRVWKKLAQRGDEKTYGVDEVRDAAIYALSKDFKNEVSGKLLRALRSIFDGTGNSLLMPDVAMRALDDARHLAAGSVFGLSAVRWCEEFVQTGAFGRDNFHDAIGCAVQDRGYAGQRQVQEHYLREASARRADSVASRLGAAIDSLNVRDVGRSFTGDGERATPPRKRASVDEGVELQ